MYNYIDESTNDISNPFNQQRSHLKQKLIDQLPPQHYDQDYSQTIANRHLFRQTEDQTIRPGKLPKKIQASTLQSNKQPSPQLCIFDDSLTKTRKINNKKTTKSQLPQNNFILTADAPNKNQINNLQIVPQKLVIPEPSPQVQSIVSGPKLREKYGFLIPKTHQKTLSYQQHHLLKVFSMMDETIQFSNKNRSVKFVFFEELRKNIRDSMKVFIQMRHLQQLLYLDESLFEVKWQYSCEKRNYDIMIILPKIKSKDQRKTKLREIMVDFLDQKHKEFLFSKGLKLNQADGQWHPEFQPGNYEIPRKNIPVHPETRDAQLRCFDQNKIQEIKNTKLKQLIQNKKQQSQIQSFKSKSVMDMIFAGVSSKNIENQIMKAVKEKQQNVKKNKILEDQRIVKQKTEIEPDILKEISQTILLIYMSKSVSNIFKVKLIELVKEKTNHKFGNYIVDRHVEHLIELKEIGYLKEIVAGKNKPVMVQINKGKAKEIVVHAERLKQKQKQQRQHQSNNHASAEIII